MKGKSTSTSKRRKTKWQMLLGAKKRHCAGKITKAAMNKAATAYVQDAVKKGKTKTEATKSVTKLVNSSCSVSGTGKKRKPASAKKRKTNTGRKTTRRR